MGSVTKTPGGGIGGGGGGGGVMGRVKATQTGAELEKMGGGG